MLKVPHAERVAVSTKTKRFAVAVIIIVSAVCLWRGGRGYARYQEQRLTARARLFLQNGSYKEAFLTTQQILGANPANVSKAPAGIAKRRRAKCSRALGGVRLHLIAFAR